MEAVALGMEKVERLFVENYLIMIITYGIIAVLLIVAELVYFKVADHFNIIDKPNERSSHSTIVLRGGGIIFVIGVWIWSLFFGFQYPWFLIAVTLAAGIRRQDQGTVL